ncbi:MAG: cystathionine gamma-synthase family protein [Azospirillaceae bacterium]|nr:cystathionine gamma-synthase family protein [Azospirillaceae bacterium]
MTGDPHAPGPTLHPETLTVAAGYDAQAHHGAVKPPLFLTSTFVYPSAQHAKAAHEAYFAPEPPTAGPRPAFIYARLDHPNLVMVEERLARLDRAEDAAAFNSGMAAISTVMHAFLRPGTTILHTRPIYGGTDVLIHRQLSQFGITPVGIEDGLDAVSVRRAAAAARAIGPLALVLIETPANPTSGIADIALIAAVADEIGRDQGQRPVVAVDNTFLGPFLQTPLEHGADLTITSLTKYAGGHSDLLGGGVSGRAALIAPLKQLRTVLGSPMDPHTCWMLLRSFETLHLRTERAGSNARVLAEFLRGHPRIAQVNYIGFREPGSAARTTFDRQCRGAGSTFSFRIHGGEAEAFRMLDRLRVIRMAVSLGGTETLICHSASTTHYAVPPERRALVGIDDSSLRISVGIEHCDDLIGDLAQALEAI